MASRLDLGEELVLYTAAQVPKRSAAVMTVDEPYFGLLHLLHRKSCR